MTDREDTRMTEQDTSPYSGRPVTEWFDEQYTLSDAQGDKVGEIVEINPDFVIAQTGGGFLGLGERRRYYVPRDAIVREDGTEWYLSMTKDQVESMGWSEPPAGSSYAGGDWRQEYDATDADVVSTDVTSAGDAGSTSSGTGRTRLVTHEEQLQARPVAQQVGEVSLRKEVVEEVQTIEVPVRREEVVIERHAVTGDVADATAFGTYQETIRVPVMEEKVEVNKVVRPVEEVELSKRTIEDTETVSDTVRHEEIRVEGDQSVVDESDRRTR